jgi:hypothetical protein
MKVITSWIPWLSSLSFIRIPESEASYETPHQIGVGTGVQCRTKYKSQWKLFGPKAKPRSIRNYRLSIDEGFLWQERMEKPQWDPPLGVYFWHELTIDRRRLRYDRKLIEALYV